MNYEKSHSAITFPAYSGVRCLMMPYIQGDPDSVPLEYDSYRDIIESTYISRGDVGYLTIDESFVVAGNTHRGARAKYGRALHTEAGLIRGIYGWGDGPVWGGRRNVELDRDTRVILANSIDGSCAIWDAEHADTSEDGDIGDRASMYPYSSGHFMGAGEVCEIGILTPHESLPVKESVNRQFLRIISSGVRGREPYFTVNPLLG